MIHWQHSDKYHMNIVRRYFYATPTAMAGSQDGRSPWCVVGLLSKCMNISDDWAVRLMNLYEIWRCHMLTADLMAGLTLLHVRTCQCICNILALHVLYAYSMIAFCAHVCACVLSSLSMYVTMFFYDYSPLADRA